LFACIPWFGLIFTIHENPKKGIFVEIKTKILVKNWVCKNQNNEFFKKVQNVKIKVIYF